jgi:hypothetical protein
MISKMLVALTTLNLEWGDTEHISLYAGNGLERWEENIHQPMEASVYLSATLFISRLQEFIILA